VFLRELFLTNEDYLIMSSQVIEGTVNFSNVTKTDVFNGQDTGMFSMTITMSDDDAATLAAQGVKIKDYEGAKQRKFKSKYAINMYDAEGDRYNGEVPYNSRVRLKFKTGPAHPVHGTPVYLEAVKVLEEAEVSAEAADF
jgi:hypothetical protein